MSTAFDPRSDNLRDALLTTEYVRQLAYKEIDIDNMNNYAMAKSDI